MKIDDAEYRAAAPRDPRDHPPGVAVGRREPLRRPPAPARRPDATIPTGGVIGQGETTTAVDLDQLFNTFDPKTRKALSGLIRGENEIYAGRGAEAGAGLGVPQPGACGVRPPVPGGQRRHAAAAAVHRRDARASSPTSRSAARSSPGSSTTSRRRPAALGRQSDALGHGIGAAARLHAPGEHDVRQPPRDARRRRAARRGVQAGREEAAPVLRRAAPARARRAADAARPVADDPARPARTTTSSS